MSFQSMLANLQQIAAANGAKLGTGISNWKKTPTNELVSLADKGVSLITTEYGKRLAVSGMDGDKEVTLYFALSGDITDETKSFEIVLLTYVGDKPEGKQNCFKAFAL